MRYIKWRHKSRSSTSSLSREREKKSPYIFITSVVALMVSLSGMSTWGMMNEEGSEAALSSSLGAGVSGRALTDQVRTLSISEEEKTAMIQALENITDEGKRELVGALALKTELVGTSRISMIETLSDFSEEFIRSTGAAAVSLCTPQMEGHHMGSMFIALDLAREEGEGAAITLARLARSLFRDEDRSNHEIVSRLYHCPMQNREAVCALAATLRTQYPHLNAGELSDFFTLFTIYRDPIQIQQAMDATNRFAFAGGPPPHDLSRCISAFARLAGDISIPQRAEAVAQALERDMVTHNLLEGERFARIIQLIENPEAPFRREDLDITGQEALSAGREAIYEGWNRLKMRTDVGVLILSKEEAAAEFPIVMNTIQDYLARALEGDLSLSERFRLKTALEAIEYVSRIRSDFKPRQDMPTLAQSVVTLYRALSQYHNLEEYIKTSIYRDFKRLQSLLPDLASPFTEVGHFLESTQGSELVRGLVSTFETGEGCFPMELKSAQLKWIAQLRKAMDLERLNPLVEALFMAKRGHCKRLMDPLESHNQACADGVVLNFLRSFSEIPQFQQGGGQMSTVTLLRCDAVGDGITEPIPHGRR